MSASTEYALGRRHSRKVSVSRQSQRLGKQQRVRPQGLRRPSGVVALHVLEIERDLFDEAEVKRALAPVAEEIARLLRELARSAA